MDGNLLILKYVEQIKELYTKLENEQNSFNVAAQISCLPSCGKCCNNPEIEISPLEAYPWAMQVIKNGETEKYLEKISGAVNNICVFYCHADDNHDSGYCGNYQLRPLLCRLFGCSVLPDKLGNPRPVLCKLIKNADPELEQRVKNVTSDGIDAPVFNAYYTRLTTIDPFWGNLREPINQAFLHTLEKLSYLAELNQ